MKATILLMNESLRREKPIFNSLEQTAYAKQHRAVGFTEVATIEVMIGDPILEEIAQIQPLQVAEEIWDLTNNPFRQEERERVYGKGRSVSSGDIVKVGDIEYVCCSFSWEILK